MSTFPLPRLVLILKPLSVEENMHLLTLTFLIPPEDSEPNTTPPCPLSMKLFSITISLERVLNFFASS